MHRPKSSRGLTAADEDEESKATEDAAAFLFHGFSVEDAQRFSVTTKSNGENGKYTFRKVFGEWYCLSAFLVARGSMCCPSSQAS